MPDNTKRVRNNLKVKLPLNPKATEATNDGSLRIKIKFENDKTGKKKGSSSNKKSKASTGSGSKRDGKKNGRNSVSTDVVRRRKSDRKKKSKRGVSEVGESEEELNAKFYSYCSNMWKIVDEYMGTIRDEDIEACSPEQNKLLTEDDPFLKIPKKGRSEIVDENNGNVKVENTVPDVHCFDLTSRILSALVEENKVNHGRTSQKKLKIVRNMMVCDREPESMKQIEEKLSTELARLQILPFGGVGSKPQQVQPLQQNEEDEISKELKILQQDLKSVNLKIYQRKKSVYDQLVNIQKEQLEEKKLIEKYLEEEEECFKQIKILKRQRSSLGSKKATKKARTE